MQKLSHRVINLLEVSEPLCNKTCIFNPLCHYISDSPQHFFHINKLLFLSCLLDMWKILFGMVWWRSPREVVMLWASASRLLPSRMLCVVTSHAYVSHTHTLTRSTRSPCTIATGMFTCDLHPGRAAGEQGQALVGETDPGCTLAEGSKDRGEKQGPQEERGLIFLFKGLKCI